MTIEGEGRKYLHNYLQNAFDDCVIEDVKALIYKCDTPPWGGEEYLPLLEVVFSIEGSDKKSTYFVDVLTDILNVQWSRITDKEDAHVVDYFTDNHELIGDVTPTELIDLCATLVHKYRQKHKVTTN